MKVIINTFILLIFMATSYIGSSCGDSSCHDQCHSKIMTSSAKVSAHNSNHDCCKKAAASPQTICFSQCLVSNDYKFTTVDFDLKPKNDDHQALNLKDFSTPLSSTIIQNKSLDFDPTDFQFRSYKTPIYIYLKKILISLHS
ncbi:MAG: hypothetical protein KDD50_10995 [Bdellovibrionales bacterium]|nr:hypothetical protein [Bdellovibrionales bacterium]